MKKGLALFVALVLSLAPFAACAQAQTERPKLVVTLAQEPLVTDYYDNYYTKWVEDTLNCELEFQYLPTDPDQALSKLSLLAAADEYLGDVLVYHALKYEDVLSFSSTGIFKPLNQFIEKYDSNVEALDSQVDEDIIQSITALDGNIYGLPSYHPQKQNMTKFRWWINQKWLDNLNLKMPTTTQELYDVLKAFRDGDANGNGDPNDEIPLLGCMSGWATNPLPYIISPYTYWDDMECLQINDGKIDVAYTNDGYRQAMDYVSKLCAEDLLAKDTFSLTYSQYQEYLSKETPVVGIVCWTHLGIMGAENPNINDYVYMPYLMGEDGTQRISYEPYFTADFQSLFITKDSKDDELSWRFIDLVSGEESYNRCRFGVDGIHSDRVYDREILDKLNFPGDYMIMERTGVPAWQVSSNSCWQMNLGSFVLDRHCQWNGDPEFYFYRRYLAVQDMLKLEPKVGEYVPKLMYTADEIDEVLELKNAITTYWKECQTLFALGDMSVENDWDEYIATLKSLGLDRYLELAQNAYDRKYT